MFYVYALKVAAQVTSLGTSGTQKYYWIPEQIIEFWKQFENEVFKTEVNNWIHKLN